MFRPFTIFCALMAGGSGMFLYTKKHQTTELDQHISKIVADTQHIRQQTAVLQTEWALLNQPERLNHLAARFDPNLKPMNPNQFVRLADLKQHLPAPDSRHLAPAPETAVVASRVTEPTHAEVEPARVAVPVARQVLASASPVTSPRPAQQMALAKATELPMQPHASEATHRIEAHHVAELLRLASEAAPVAAPHKTTHHPDAQVLALDEHTETLAAHHAAHSAATPVVAADSSTATHHAASRDVASLTDVTKAPRHMVAVRTAMPSDIAKPHTSSLTSAPVTVAAWHPATAPRYVEARAIYSGSLLGRSAIGGGLPPPMPVSN